MELWTNWQAPLWKSENKVSKYFDVPLRSSLRVISETVDGYYVDYLNANGVSTAGWIEHKYAEPYVRNLPHDLVDVVEIQTPNPNDAEQYILWNKVKQVNMCGEMCIAYLLGISLKELLERWKVRKPSLIAKIFGSGFARGTNYQEIIELAGALGMMAVPLAQMIKKYTPNNLWRLDETSRIIVSCRIDGNGVLRSSGVLHWVVVADVIQERKEMGWVDVYNPFPNCIERYSWREFVASAGNPYGIVTGI